MIEDFDDDVIDLVVKITDIIQSHVLITSSEETMFKVLDEIAEAVQEFKNDQ